MSLLFRKPQLKVIGSTEFIDVARIKNVPAKIDTGADSSAIWASNIEMQKNGILKFSLFDKNSPYFTGEILETRDYKVKSVRSSHGDKQVRYRIKLPIKLSGRKFETTFTLADRKQNNFPVLIGRRTLKGNFLVNVSEESVERPKPTKTPKLNQELKKDPYKFHQKYIKK